ncbi:MAG: 16S rRNA (guanine(966)-N(2))-methyltransferase RsmD [Planctomycetaceae bacterium]|nr:16S rRNA (guanine(966)-N(2))-methyltransferase RsmD [Planctomycetaceae bacterium]
MRIISGKYRRRKLLSNSGRTTRPITDRAKEYLFEHIRFEVRDRCVLDAFSGTGSLGLEAISRGSSSVVFIEQDRKAHELLRRNVEAIGVEEPHLCWRADILKTSFRPKTPETLFPYSLVFFDPPYRMIQDLRPKQEIYRSLTRLAKETVTTDDVLLVLRTPEHSKFEMPECWELRRHLYISTMTLYLYHKSKVESESADELATSQLGIG